MPCLALPEPPIDARKMEDELLFADGFDEAVLGIGRRAAQPEVVAYDYEKCVLILMDREMTEEEAREYMEFNVVGGFVGDRTPIFIEPFDALFVEEEQKTH